MFMQRSVSEPPHPTAHEIDEKTMLPEKILQAKNHPSKKYNKRRRREVINKVPNLIRLEKHNPIDYQPLLASLGPYHHGKMELQLAEDFKIMALEMFIADSGKDVEYFFNMVLQLVNYARTCYVDDSTSAYDDPTFAQMLLLDAAFIINFIVLHRDVERLEITGIHLGDLVYAVLWRDLLLLENQIPFRVLKDLILVGYGVNKGEEMLRGFLSLNILGICRQQDSKLSNTNEAEPFHILDAFWLVLVTDHSKTECVQGSGFGFFKRVRTDIMARFRNSYRCMSKDNRSKDVVKDEEYGEPEWIKTVKRYIHSYRSVTDLKSKGISFIPQCGHNLHAIKFRSGYFNAQVEIPSWYMFEYTKVVVSNMIAHELCRTSYRVLAAYIDFITSLIDSDKDVKELRDKKILFTTLKSDEEVATLCKQINLLGWKNGNIFVDIKEEIQAHYDNYGKTWLADLSHTYFRTPWTTVALLAATFLLVLTFLQTYYSIK